MKAIDFTINYNKQIIGYITAKYSIGSGGHQDNVISELNDFCNWSLKEIKKSENKKKVYIVLYDNFDNSNHHKLQNKYKNENLIISNTINFNNDFLIWFNKNYKL